MKVPFLDLKIQYQQIKNDVDPIIQNIFENTAFIGGKIVKEFEANFAEKNNSKHFISCANGTDAIYLTLRALGIGYGDEVILPANTFIASAEPVTQCGAVPVFVDQEADHYHIDPNLIEDKITPRTKAIIAVHLYGQAADLDPIIEIAKKHDLHLIEDCAQAHFAEYNGKKVGNYGVAGTFSFYPGKNLGAAGDAGGIVTNDNDLANKIRLIANHGSIQKYVHEVEGVNSRMDAIQAAFLNAKLRHIDSWNNSRYENSLYYNSILDGIEQVKTPKKLTCSQHINHLYVVRVEKREELIEFLNSNGVSTGMHYPEAIPYMKAYSRLNHVPADFPIAYKYQSQILSLPMFAELTKEQMDYVAEKIKEFYN